MRLLLKSLLFSIVAIPAMAFAVSANPAQQYPVKIANTTNIPIIITGTISPDLQNSVILPGQTKTFISVIKSETSNKTGIVSDDIIIHSGNDYSIICTADGTLLTNVGSSPEGVKMEESSSIVKGKLSVTNFESKFQEISCGANGELSILTYGPLETDRIEGTSITIQVIP